MKHSRFLDEQLGVYPLDVRTECINYHKWKLWIKTEPEFLKKNWKSHIKQDCTRVENFLYPRFAASLPESWVRHLSILNTDTFYKICKKMRKKLGFEEPLEYYRSCVNKRKYKFTSVSFVTLV